MIAFSFVVVVVVNNNIILKLLTSFDGGYIHQESWSWVE